MKANLKAIEQDFLRFSDSQTFIEYLISDKFKNSSGRDIRGKWYWEPYLRFKEEYDNEKAWSTWKGKTNIPVWLRDYTHINDIMNNSDGRKIDVVGITPIGWSISEHKDWSKKPNKKFKTFVSSDYAADSICTYRLTKNKDDFLKLWNNPCIVDSFRVNTYNKDVSREFHKQYRNADRIPDFRLHHTFVNSNQEYDKELWQFIHNKIKQKKTEIGVKNFRARHPRQQEVVDNRVNYFTYRIMRGKRAPGWDGLTGRAGKMPMASESIAQVYIKLGNEIGKLNGNNTFLLVHGYHSRQVLSQNESEKLQFLRGHGIYPDTYCVTRATVRDPFNVPYDQGIKKNQIADKIIDAIENNIPFLNIPYLYHHSTILLKALQKVKRVLKGKFKGPSVRWKDELDYPIGSLDSSFRPGYDVHQMNSWIDFGDTGTIIENDTIGMNRKDVVGPQLHQNTITMKQGSDMGLTKEPVPIINIIKQTELIKRLEKLGYKVKKKKVKGGKYIVNVHQYIKSEYVIINGNTRYLTLNEAMRILAGLQILNENPTKMNAVLTTSTRHKHGELYRKNMEMFDKNIYGGHPAWQSLKHFQYEESDTETIATDCLNNLKAYPRTKHDFVNKATRGFTVNPLNTYLPLDLKCFTNMAQEWYRVLGLDTQNPKNDKGYIILTWLIDDVSDNKKMSFEGQVYTDLKNLSKLGYEAREWIDSGFKSKNEPGEKKPNNNFVLNKPADISHDALKELLMNNKSYRSDFIVNEYVDAHNWYTDEYRLLENPNDAKQRGELQQRFLNKFKTLWAVSVASNKKRTIGAWVRKFCNGSHNFQQNYDQIDKNLKILEKFRKSWLDKKVNEYDNLMHKFRTLCDKKAYDDVTFPPRDLGSEIQKLFKKYIKFNAGFRSAKMKLQNGVHHYLSEEGQQEQQEWMYARRKRCVDRVIDSLKYLCNMATIEMRSGQFREKFGFTDNVGDQIYFSYKKDYSHKMSEHLRNNPEIIKWVKVWQKKMKELKTKPDITDDVINLAKKWFDNHAPWWIETHSNNAGKKVVKRNIWIKLELKKKYGLEISDSDISAILFPLRWYKTRKIKRVKLFTKYDMDVTVEKQKKMIEYGKARNDKIIKRLRIYKKIYFKSQKRPSRTYMAKITGGMHLQTLLDKFKRIR